MLPMLSQIQHIVVVMLENRSFDNLCGWLYSGTGNGPDLFLPPGTTPNYNGLNSELWNPANASFFSGQPPQKVPIVEGTTSETVPNPDPEETFDNVTYQLYGPQGAAPNPTWPNLGFVVNYEDATNSDPQQIMESYKPSQVPVLSALAKNYAISDEWFCSVPSQTWPNRAFVHAGTANGNVNNGDPVDPYDWDVQTIFNLFQHRGVSWAVYSDTILTPSLTRIMFPKLWDPWLDGHFLGLTAFEDACASNTLPRYSFLEPSFLFEPNDEHPPHSVAAGEQLLYKIWKAISSSQAWNATLLIITYDEHGGCYDHVLPPAGAATPDSTSNPGDENFYFNRFGARVPTVLVSPIIRAGTVFRSGTSTPYDHTSVLATLRDWLGIPSTDMLPSARIAAAPNLAQVLTLETPRTDKPSIPTPRVPAITTPLDLPLNDLQRSMVAGSARRFGMEPLTVLRQISTRQQAIDFFKRRSSRAHA